MRGRVGVSVGVVVGVSGEPSRHPTALALAAAAAARSAASRRARAVPLVYHEVDRHFALQTADVAVAEVIAEFVYLQKTKGRYDIVTAVARGEFVGRESTPPTSSLLLRKPKRDKGEDGAQEKKDSFNILLSSSLPRMRASVFCARRGTASPASENVR